jgi:hypothetical protein
LITESNIKGKKWYDGHKAWMSDDWKYVIWSDEKVVFHAVPNIRPGLRLENTQESL